MRRFLFAGGGTGGHLFPSLAIWEQLQRLAPADKVEALFICSDRPLDAKILEEAGVPYRVCPAAPLARQPLRLARFALGWQRTMRQVKPLLAEPGTQVVAMGGFVAGPVATAGRAVGRRVTLVNLDAVPGKANRYLATKADDVLSAVPVAIDDPTGTFRNVTGLPVRLAARSPDTTAACRRELGLDADRPVLLVTGASQGATSLNDWLRYLALEKPDTLAGWQVLHLGGRGEEEALRTMYERANVPARVLSFLSRMGLAWGAAEAAVSRAGASSVAEAAVNRVPTLFLPYPYHKDQHQRTNAMRVTDANGGILGEDRIDPLANDLANGDSLRWMLASSEVRQAMRAALTRIEDGKGAERVAGFLLHPDA